jgi:hypothetical protein
LSEFAREENNQTQEHIKKILSFLEFSFLNPPSGQIVEADLTNGVLLVKMPIDTNKPKCIL